MTETEARAALTAFCGGNARHRVGQQSLDQSQTQSGRGGASADTLDRKGLIWD